MFTNVPWFGASVTAPAPLTMEYPVPLRVTPEIATFELPVFVTAKLCAAEFPSVTLPKLKLVGFTLMVRVAATAVALSATVAGEFGALLTMLSEPVTFPAAVGAY